MSEAAPPAKRKTLGCGGAVAICLFALLVAVAMTADDQASKATTRPQTLTATPGPAAKRAALALRDSIIAALKPCDAAGASLAKVAGKLGSGASVYDGYASANSTTQACGASWDAIRTLDTPESLSGDAADKATETISRCADLAFAKKRGAEAMMTVFDGDMRPSAIEEVKSRTALVESYTMGCAAGMLGTALAAGVDAKELAGR